MGTFDFTPYLTIAINIFSVFAGYFFGVRRYKTEYFYNNLKECLGFVLSPMLNEMKKIKNEDCLYSKEKLLKSFFDKYCCPDTMIYKIGNLFILQWFLDMEVLYREYCKCKDCNTWEKFWVKFEYYYIMIEDYYDDAFSTLYIDHKWMLKLQSSSFTYRFFNELARFIHEYIKIFVAAGAMIILAILSDIVSGTKIFSNEVISIFLIIYLMVVGLFGFTMMLATNYAVSINSQKTKSNFKKFIEKKIPKVIKWWGEFPKSKSKDDNILIPNRECFNCKHRLRRRAPSYNKALTLRHGG